MKPEELWAEPKVWRLSELTAIADRMWPPPRCDMFSNNNGVQSFRIVSSEGYKRCWVRVDSGRDGTAAGFIETPADV